MKIEDIANLASTSKATVSLALNNKPGVSPETKAKILQICKEYNYTPKHYKKNNVHTVSNIIRLVAVLKPDTSAIHNFGTSFFTELINGIENNCNLLGYNLVYSSISYSDFPSKIKEQEALNQSAGIILIGTYLSKDEIEKVISINSCVVLLDCLYEHKSFNTVCINNFMGGFYAATHLISLGHKNIGYIQSTVRIPNLSERMRGFVRALEENNLSLLDDYVFSINSYMDSSVSVLRDKLKLSSSLPSSFFCETDYNAICLLGALNELGISVPKEVSIVGFDDVPETNIIFPRITTIHVKKDIMAKLIVSRINEMIVDKNSNDTVKTLVDVSLVVRDSTSSPAKE